MNEGACGAFELQWRPLLLENAPAAARYQRLDPWKLLATVTAESPTSWFAADPAERRNDEIERSAEHFAQLHCSLASQPAAVCDDQVSCRCQL